MHKHDHDLIMALAEGTLPDAEAAAAERSIAGCAECRDDLALNRMALEAMAAAPAPQLNDIERASLRRVVWESVDHAPETVRPTVLQPRRFRPWMAAAAVAAVFLSIVVAGPVLNNLGGSDDAATVAADVTTTEAARSLGEHATAESADSDLEEVAPETTTTPAAEAPAADSGGAVEDLSADGQLFSLRDLGDIDVSDESLDLDTLNQLRVNPEFSRGVEVEVVLPQCYEAAVADLAPDDEVRPWFVGVLFDDEVVGIRYVVDGEPVLALLDFDTCEVVFQLQ